MKYMLVMRATDESFAAMGETDWSTPWWEDRQPTLAD